MTGEERQYAVDCKNESAHISCTVEMARVNENCKNFQIFHSLQQISRRNIDAFLSFPDTDEVAVIDEIQMIKDVGRGWAWTRALLGIAADEIHLCGEAGAIDLVCFILSYLFPCTAHFANLLTLRPLWKSTMKKNGPHFQVFENLFRP